MLISGSIHGSTWESDLSHWLKWNGDADNGEEIETMGVQALDRLSVEQSSRRKAGSGWKASGNQERSRVSTSSHEEREELEQREGLGLKQTRSLTQSVDYWFSGIEWS